MIKNHSKKFNMKELMPDNLENKAAAEYLECDIIDNFRSNDNN